MTALLPYAVLLFVVIAGFVLAPVVRDCLNPRERELDEWLKDLP